MLNITNKKINYWSGNIVSKCNVILVSGKIGVGKTTFSNILKTELGNKFSNVDKESFSRAVKDCAKSYFGWDGKKDERGRKLLQLIGTEVGRWYDNDIWVKHFIGKLQTYMFYPNIVVVDDWRFLNEYTFLSDNNFDVFALRVVSDTLGEDSEHISEHSLPKDFKYDYIINNSRDIEYLKQQAKEFVKIISEKE